MKNLLLKTLAITFLIFTFLCNAKSLERNNKIECLVDRIVVPFSENSIEIDSIASNALDSNLSYVLDAIKHKCYLVVIPWSCVKETDKDPSIGIKRAKVIIDFYNQKYSIPIENFFIIDEQHREDFIWVNSCSESSFVTFSLRFCGKNKS